jgi:hypothetical protein
MIRQDELMVRARFWAGGALTAILVMSAASCSSGRHTISSGAQNTTASTVATTATSATTPVTATGITSSSASTAATPTAATTACQPSQLSVARPRWNGAAGTAFYLFQITNTSATSCQVGGFFGVSLYDRDGHLLTDKTVRSTNLPNESGPATPLLLAPGNVAHFVVSFSENGESCPSIGSFHLIPPNARSQLQVSLSPPPGTTYVYCSSPVQVSPTKSGAAPTS